jgi:hypothetical protein
VSDRPNLPEGALFGILGDIVRVSAPTTEADPAGVLASLLTMVSGLVGRDPHLQIGNTRHPLLIWTLLLGSTGRGRKGEAMATARRFVDQADDQYAAIAVSGLSTGEGLIERIRDTEEGETGGTEDKRLVVIEPEFATVLARARREGNTIGSIMREAWDGGRLGVMNRKALAASTSHVAVSGHISPMEFRAKISASDMAGGTYNRFLPFYVARSKELALPSGVDFTTLGQRSLELRRAVQAAQGIEIIGMDNAARDIWAGGMYSTITGAAVEDGPVAQFTQRAAPYTLRIAALFAALQGQAWISAPELQAAYEVVRYATASAEYVLSTIPSQAEQERDQLRCDLLAVALDKVGPAGLTRAEVSALYGRHLDRDGINQVINQVTADGLYEAIDRPSESGRGRPAQVVRRRASA